MAPFATVEGRKLRRKVRALITDTDGWVLLIQPQGYPNGSWTLPGGGVEEGETTRAAVMRELQEELGLSTSLVRSISPLNVRSEFIYGDAYRAKRGLDHDGQLADLFHCLIPSGTVIHRQVDEVADVRWFTSHAAVEAFRVPAQRLVFEQCLSKIELGGKGLNRVTNT